MAGMRELEKITFAAFEAMEKTENLTYELIDGLVLMSPRPAIEHQRINFKLTMELWNVLKGKGCEPIQEIDLVLGENNFVPDIMVVCNDELKGNRHEKPPMIVIEIVSPSSPSRDYFLKRNKYEQLGIQEYWIVEPKEKCVMVIAFGTGQQERYCEGTMKSFVMPELEIALHQIFSA